MKGFIITIPVMGEITSEEINTPHIYMKLQKIVGGYIEQVPYFNKFVWHGEKRDCFAFCNEEGKILDLPVNHRATFYWLNAVNRPLDDVLMGDVAVVLGDEEFLSEV